MGQQQLLLLVLGAIIVGIAIVVGINMFAQNALSSNIDAVRQDCLSIIAKAQQWYRTPAPLGGPATHHTFTDLDFQKLGYPGTGAFRYENEHGVFKLSGVSDTDFDLTGVTVEKDGSNSTWKVTFTDVSATSIPSAVSAEGS